MEFVGTLLKILGPSEYKERYDSMIMDRGLGPKKIEGSLRKYLINPSFIISWSYKGKIFYDCGDKLYDINHNWILLQDNDSKLKLIPTKNYFNLDVDE